MSICVTGSLQARPLNPMQVLADAIKAGYRPTATDTKNMLYELQAAFGDWEEALWMNSNPESWADEIVTAQTCGESDVAGLFDLPSFPSIRSAS